MNDENQILKKKLSTYVSDKGRLTNVPEEILLEVLKSWQVWPGKAKDFYKMLGFSYRQMAGILGKAKRLQREGFFGPEEFKEVKVEEEVETEQFDSKNCNLIELDNGDGKVIRFPRVKQLLEYMKKVS